MLYSVLVAHYNNSRFLTTALTSVFNQTFSNWEVILVDDGSTDNFEHVILPYLNDRRIKIFRNDSNKGCGYTKRKCAALASGEIMGFLDPDDALHPNALSIMYEQHMARPDCSLIYSGHYLCDAGLHVKRQAEYIRALPEGVPYLLLGDASIHLFASFTRTAYAATEGINEKYHKAVDKDLYYKLEEEGAVLFVNQYLYYYRIHDGSISNNGQEKSASLIHYGVAREACKRRIKKLRSETDSGNSFLIKQYRARYYKIAVFENFHKKRWIRFIGSLVIYPFVGGLPNTINYCRKLKVQGRKLLSKSFLDHYEIKT